MITNNIVLIGFKNSGKSSVGKCLAEKMQKNFVDTDHLIEQYFHIKERTLLTVREIYQQMGEADFRELEKKVIVDLDSTHDSVIATGGGCILNGDNVTSLKKAGVIVYLSASFATLLDRMSSSTTSSFLDAGRTPKYKAACDIEISTDDKTLTKVVEELMRKLCHEKTTL